ncbi:hypothetical protein KAS50_02765 [bacterium]|nr:hypothetical protein [bacterium]
MDDRLGMGMTVGYIPAIDGQACLHHRGTRLPLQGKNEDLGFVFLQIQQGAEALCCDKRGVATAVGGIGGHARLPRNDK